MKQVELVVVGKAEYRQTKSRNPFRVTYNTLNAVCDRSSSRQYLL